MVHEIMGDALDVFKGGILCHQTNYFGVMGAGIAAAIRQKLLNKEMYQEYIDMCRKYGSNAVGKVQFLILDDGVVANCFSQNDKNNTYPHGRISPITDYQAVEQCFIGVRHAAIKWDNCRVYVPYKYGCGIAGGDWNTVRAIIEEVFKDSAIDVYIVRRPGD